MLQKDLLGQDMFLVGSPGLDISNLINYYYFRSNQEVSSFVVLSIGKEGM